MLMLDMLQIARESMAEGIVFGQLAEKVEFNKDHEALPQKAVEKLT